MVKYQKGENMKKVAVIFACGMEEIEAITPVDVLRRACAQVDVVSIGEREVKGSHNITVVADKLIGQVDLNSYDALVIPGGMPGATNIASKKEVLTAIKSALENGKIVGAICASPAVVLGANGLINGKATCYPADDFIKILGEKYTGSDVEVCDNLITANGPKSALKFAIALVTALGLTPAF